MAEERYVQVTSWEVVRSIANATMTNALWAAYVGCSEAAVREALKYAHVAKNPIDGCGRWFDAEPIGFAVAANDDGWFMLDEAHTRKIEWQSATSGSRLIATKVDDGWELEYVPPEADPDYWGVYGDAWCRLPGDEKNFDPGFISYVRGEHT